MNIESSHSGMDSKTYEISVFEAYPPFPYFSSGELEGIGNGERFFVNIYYEHDTKVNSKETERNQMDSLLMNHCVCSEKSIR